MKKERNENSNVEGGKMVNEKIENQLLVYLSFSVWLCNTSKVVLMRFIYTYVLYCLFLTFLCVAPSVNTSY